MPTLQVVPHLGLSDIRFGMNRTACRTLIGSTFVAFSRRGDDFLEVDAFDGFGVQLSFTAADTLEFIEAHAPSKVEYDGVPLLGRQVADVVADLDALGLSGLPDDVGVDYPTRGFGLYAPEGTVEGVSVYPDGYYQDG